MAKYKSKNCVGLPFMTKIVYRGAYGEIWHEDEKPPKKLSLRYFNTKEEMNTWLDNACAKGKIFRIEGYYEKVGKKYVAYYKPPWD